MTFVKAVRLKGCVMVPESVGIAQHVIPTSVSTAGPKKGPCVFE